MMSEKVLIVAECNVNLFQYDFFYFYIAVLIVAECNVNATEQ